LARSFVEGEFFELLTRISYCFFLQFFFHFILLLDLWLLRIGTLLFILILILIFLFFLFDVMGSLDFRSEFCSFLDPINMVEKLTD
jgi:hypothetical protein